MCILFFHKRGESHHEFNSEKYKIFPTLPHEVGIDLKKKKKILNRLALSWTVS